MSVLCIIPIYNEEIKLRGLLEEIKKFKLNDNLDINFLLINNGSTDRSLDIIKEYNFKYISLRRNKGIGYSLLVGLRIAKKQNYKILVHMAGNSKMSPYDISKMINPLINGNFEYVSGTRFSNIDNYSTNPIFRIISIKALSLFFSVLFKKKITDATCGFRAFFIENLIKEFKYFNKKKYYTYGYEYYSYGKILKSKKIKSCEANVQMNYPTKGNYSKIKPVIDWFPIIFGYIEALMDNKKIF